MEGNVVAEMRVLVQQLAAAVASAVALVVAGEQVDDAVLNLFCDLRKVHVVAAASRALAAESQEGASARNGSDVHT